MIKQMKKLCFNFTIVTTLIYSAYSYAEFPIDNPPLPTAYVNDYAHLLSNRTVKKLNTELKDYERTTSNQIVVAIFPGTVPDSIEDFSIKLEEKWKIGQKGKDNGVLLIIFPEDRQLRIEVGYGLEGKIPDSIANLIITQSIVPAFKIKHYDQGVINGTQEIIKAISGQSKISKSTPQNSASTSKDDPRVTALFFLVFGFLFGAGIGPIVALFACLTQLGFAMGLLSWIGGFILYAIIYHLLPASFRFKHPYQFLLGGFKGGRSNSNGGGFGGGGGGGGFSSGGGSSGGGGASGRW